MIPYKLAGNLLLITWVIIVTFSCGNHTATTANYDDTVVLGRASPIQLLPDSTVVVLEDYLVDKQELDSISITKGLLFYENKNSIIIKGQLDEPLGNLSFWRNGQHYDILLKKNEKIRYQLQYSGKASTVKTKGEFNAWNADHTIFKKKGELWQMSLLLQPGMYQYLFVVDGVEMLDPSNPDSISNGMGSWNSVINIRESNQNDRPWLTTVKYLDNNVLLSSSQPVQVVFAYWENTKIEASIEGKSLSINIPKTASEYKRSHIRVWAYNQTGASNDVLIPLDFGRVVNKATQLERSDLEANIFYFLMIDRFANGNPTNDEPVQDSSIHPKANYYGGDLKGITQKIKEGYFDSLSINTLWLSPITQNPLGAYGKYPNPLTTFSGYHGYWPISSSKIDHRFGNDDELHKLLDVAHSQNINVILDYVANHVHEEHPAYQQHKDWATSLYLPDGSLNTERWDDHRLTTWFDTFLPTLDLSRSEIVDSMTDSALYWLKKFDFDGFRHDATKHIPFLFWRELTKKIKKEVIIPTKKPIFQIGETYGSRELINSYINTGMLDAQFDFNVYDDAVQAFANPTTSLQRLADGITQSISSYGHHNLMGYITGNQDRARFISYADGSVSFDEDAKLAGWTRSIEVKDTIGYQKLNLLTAFMMSIPGIPVIYYGDEYGSPGGNDPDNRRMMKFDKLSKVEARTRATTQLLTNARRMLMPLMYGDFRILKVTHDTMIISRKYFNEEVLIVFNNSTETKTFSLNHLNEKSQSIVGHQLSKNSITLPPYSFDFIKK